MSMKDIFCQDAAVAALRRAVASGRVAGSYIFAGPEGVGRFTAAREWTKVLLCSQPSPGAQEACGRCDSCRSFDGGEHPDFHHVYKELVEFTRDGKDKKAPVALSIDVIREFLIEKVAQTPMFSRRKVFVVSEAEKLQGPAQNAMLKTLEEPPADSHIILLCTRLDKLLPTTLSRCQIVKFGPISEEKIVEELSRRGVEKGRAGYWARFTDGSLGRAIWWSGLRLGEYDCYSVKRTLVSRAAKLDLADSVDFAQWISDTAKSIVDAWEDEAGNNRINRSDIGRTVSKSLIYMVATVFSDAMKISERPDKNGDRSVPGIVNLDQIEEIRRVAGQFDAERCAEVVAEAYKAMNWIEANTNEKLVLEDLLLGIGGCGTMAMES
ncbi:MAG TPA: DNA polymerase III subunit [Sedimentisphaerales bacterium]|nr:DNA polymerase III subunit [Sedimentisphaerales bacterium]